MIKVPKHMFNLRLCKAVHEEDLRAVISALADGANPNASDIVCPVDWQLVFREETRKSTILHEACSWSKDTRIVELLLAAGADINARDKSGNVPFHYASYANATDICHFLIEAVGIDLDIQNDKGLTPLHTAAFHNGADTCMLLGRAGANPFIKNVDGETPLEYAEHQKKLAAANVLRAIETNYVVARATKKARRMRAA